MGLGERLVHLKGNNGPSSSKELTLQKHRLMFAGHQTNSAALDVATLGPADALEGNQNETSTQVM